MEFEINDIEIKIRKTDAGQEIFDVIDNKLNTTLKNID